MEVKTLDDKDLRLVCLAALDAFEKCLSPREGALKIAANTVYRDIQTQSARLSDFDSHDVEGF
jgi:hypothetical protein